MLINRYGVAVGSDPEIVLMRDNKPYSSEGLLGGSKRSPRKTTNGYIVEDNVLAEVNSNPARTVEEFIRNHHLILADLKDIVEPLNLGLDFSATAVFEEHHLMTEQATTVGCEPDFNAWAEDMNKPPKLGKTNLRSAGGHLHISFPVDIMDNSRIWLIRVMDCIAGVPSLLMDDNKLRRSLYGKAGCHRPKFKEEGHPYDGVEYRVLSNFWLQSEAHMAWAFNSAIEAVNRLEEFRRYIESGKIIPDNIISAINNSDVGFANDFVKTYDLRLAA